jgi:hypothetical protein
MRSTLPAIVTLTLALATPSPAAAQKPSAASVRSAQPARFAKSAIDSGALNDRRGMQVLVRVVRGEIVSAADAMPADKYTFTPTDGEFRGVRSFGRQIKHLAATNYILAAAALGKEPPADAGDEMGPDSVMTKPDIVAYLNGSFDALERAIGAIGDPSVALKASPISPLKGPSLSRVALITESLVHAHDHYGQMVEYLRMNGVVPPASRP